MAIRDLPIRPNLEHYRKQAKELLKGWKASDPKTTRKLADAQRAIARDHGFDTWKKRLLACFASTRRCSGPSSHDLLGLAD